MLLNHPIDYLHFVCVCASVWRIARGSQAIHVNGTQCQEGRLLIYQALLYQTAHPQTRTHMHTIYTQHMCYTNRHITQRKGTENDWTRASWRMECVYIGHAPWMEQNDGDYYHHSGLRQSVLMTEAESIFYFKGQDGLVFTLSCYICQCQIVASVYSWKSPRRGVMYWHTGCQVGKNKRRLSARVEALLETKKETKWRYHQVVTWTGTGAGISNSPEGVTFRSGK